MLTIGSLSVKKRLFKPLGFHNFWIKAAYFPCFSVLPSLDQVEFPRKLQVLNLEGAVCRQNSA